MKPSPIRVLIIEENEQFKRELAAYLSADALMDLAGCELSSEAWLQAETRDAEIDVAVLGLSDNDAVNEKNLRLLKEAGIRSIAIAHAGADAKKYYELANYMLFISNDRAAQPPDELFTRLKYQIRNARLAQAVEQGGFKGIWRVFPADKPRSPVCDASAELRKTDTRLIAIGASAGGTQALMELIPSLPPDMPAIALVQHMPEAFVELFASHLREKSQMRVCLATGGERLRRGTVYLTALDRHLTVISRGGELYIACEDGDEDIGIRPSVDKLFSSAASAAGSRAVGVILTGMGADGAKGLLEMRKAGAYTIGQDEKSCVVYGMPQAAYKMNAVAKQLPLNQISLALQRHVFSGERSRNDAGSR